MAKQKSYRDLIAEGTASRVNAMKFRIQDIHEEPGFNLREEGEELELSIQALADHIANGGNYPPIEIRIRESGGVSVVDGHRRRRAVLRAIDMGVPLQDKAGEVWMNVIAFEGNDVDRVARLMTSNESKTLSDVERANGYKRLTAFGLSPSDIALKIGRSRPHVEQLLLLANANKDVQDLVRDGKVSATSAIEIVRKHGEKAGAELKSKVDAKGGARVTEGDVKGKALPRKIYDALEWAVDEFNTGLTAKDRQILASVEKGKMEGAKITLSAELVLKLVQVNGAIDETRAAQEQKQREKAAKASQGAIE